MKLQKMILTVAVGLFLVASPAIGQTRILPFGDSVTSSFSPNSSYRYWLWQQLINAGYSVDFVGTQTGVTGGAPGNSEFDQNHEGHPGWTTSDGLFAADSIISSTSPDVVLLDLGSNDVLEGIPPGDSTTNLITIIGKFHDANPNVVILVAQPTPFVGQNKRGMSKLRGAIKKAVKIEKKAGVKVRVVNLAGSFNPRKDTVDGTHPNENGEKKIAKRYYTALRKVL
jgi:Lysophospholipase L1 and related esterases